MPICAASAPNINAAATGAGNPAKFMELWKNAGITVMPVVASVAMARMMEKAGADESHINLPRL